MALRRVLETVAYQSYMPDEVFVADDGSGDETRAITEWAKITLAIPLHHVWHPDDGFRKTIILNKAIKISKSDYIIQIDGDIVLNRHFVRDHVRVAERGFYVKGSRVLLSETKTAEVFLGRGAPYFHFFTKGITNRINSLRAPFLAPFFEKKSSRSDDLRGCNCAFWRDDFMAVNGYNNDLEGWGHEDIELAARLVNYGVMQKRVKMLAVCYHLFHAFNERSRESLNFLNYQKVLESGAKRCVNGVMPK